ncbi:hypothetical protein [Streptomyces sp. S1]|uniref:hypothetical protein n=1 Tax=unclassified Streptomyces TaxID=2593676 RepID=UPI000EF774F2|nr:hypothetical protein [Streptomyces sp. S1]
MTRTFRRTSAAAVLTACLALSVAACGGGREYAVPKEACGVALDEKTLDPFLFDGEELTVTGGSLIETGTSVQGACDIRVDGEPAVRLRVDKVDKVYDPMAELEAFRFANREKIEKLPFPGLGALGDRNSMVSTACAGPKANHLVVHVVVGGESGGDVAERRRDIEAFTVDFVPKVKKALGCTV